MRRSTSCACSFAHNPVAATIELGERYAGLPVYDLFGGGEFPVVGGDGRITLTLATQSFYWLHLGQPGYQPPHV
jgi:maltose alpha-D-glucosyltransferase/alpha-amylase